MPQCGSCSNESKYRCPSCSQLSCSVQCIRNHKLSTGCSGQIDPTSFLPKKELLTIQTLDRDYNFLQRIGREIHIDKTDARQFRVHKPRDQWRAGARVHSVSREMSRYKLNKSKWNKEQSQFEWTVEVLDPAEKTKFVQLGDKTMVASLPEMYGKPSYFEVIMRDAFGNRHQLSKLKSFQDAIRGKNILEFPTIEFRKPVESSSSDLESSSDSSESSDSESDLSSDDENHRNNDLSTKETSDGYIKTEEAGAKQVIAVEADNSDYNPVITELPLVPSVPAEPETPANAFCETTITADQQIVRSLLVEVQSDDEEPPEEDSTQNKRS